LKTNVPEYVAM